MPPIDHDIDPAQRLYTVHVLGDVDGRELLHELPRFWREHPELVEYDHLIDAMHYTGTISIEDARALAKLWYDATGGSDVGGRTAIASPDRFADLWIALLDNYFPSRRFAAFPTLAGAFAWLGRTAGASPQS